MTHNGTTITTNTTTLLLDVDADVSYDIVVMAVGTASPINETVTFSLSSALHIGTVHFLPCSSVVVAHSTRCPLHTASWALPVNGNYSESIKWSAGHLPCDDHVVLPQVGCW